MEEKRGEERRGEVMMMMMMCGLRLTKKQKSMYFCYCCPRGFPIGNLFWVRIRLSGVGEEEEHL